MIEPGLHIVQRFGVIYTLLLCLLALCLYDRTDLPPLLRVTGIMTLFVLTAFGDWSFFLMLFVVFFHRFYDEPLMKWGCYCLFAATCFEKGFLNPDEYYRFGMFLVPVLLHFYNNKRGSSHPFHKWFFYVFYPLHLVVIGVFRWYILAGK